MGSGKSKRRRITPCGSASERGSAVQGTSRSGLEERKEGRREREIVTRMRKLSRKWASAEKSTEDAASPASNSEAWSDDSDYGDEDFIPEAKRRAYRKSAQAKQSPESGSEARGKERELGTETGGLVVPGRTSSKEKLERKLKAEELHERSAQEVKSVMREHLQTVVRIATTSNNLRGTFVKALKDAATGAMMSGSELAKRATTSAQGQDEENTRQIKELRRQREATMREVEEWKSAYEELKNKSEMQSGNMPPPTGTTTRQREEAEKRGMEQAKNPTEREDITVMVREEMAAAMAELRRDIRLRMDAEKARTEEKTEGTSSRTAGKEDEKGEGTAHRPKKSRSDGAR